MELKTGLQQDLEMCEELTAAEAEAVSGGTAFSELPPCPEHFKRLLENLTEKETKTPDSVLVGWKREEDDDDPDSRKVDNDNVAGVISRVPFFPQPQPICFFL